MLEWLVEILFDEAIRIHKKILRDEMNRNFIDS